MADYVNRVLPVGDAPITGTFGADYGGYKHRGVDFGVPVGTPVFAPQEGRVSEFYNDGSFGIAVCIDHEDTPYYGLFAHLSRADVRPGQWVFAGQQLGISGNTGKSTGPHLHWQMSWEKTFPTALDKNVDPLSFPLVPLEEDVTLTEALANLQKATEDAIALKADMAALNEAVMMRFDMIALASGEYTEMKNAWKLLKAQGYIGED